MNSNAEAMTMAANSIGQAGLQGLRDGLLRAQDAASRIAGSSVSGNLDEITAAAVDLKTAELQVRASGRVIEAENRAVGGLIDILV